ncbi:MAG: (d)CMP kinase [Flavobacterium sp.]|nr:(d)CMP kinase [Flavobacterium sp.]
MKKITIAIDGYSSTGKSTLAKQIAEHFGYVFVDSGAMYRAVTLFALQNGYINEDFFDKQTLINSLDAIRLKFEFNPKIGFSEMFLNNKNVETEIRTLQVSSFVSKIAEVSEVRAKLVVQQQEMGKNKAIVMDGRDIGTVVFPDAELKIFMNASLEVKAQRRFEELIQKGDKVTFEEILENVKERDHIDTHRKDSPLVRAHDAIEIDNSKMTREQQFYKVLSLVNDIVKIE